MSRRLRGCALLLGCLLPALLCLGARGPRPARAAWVQKRTVMVPMRDGVKLATDLYLPPNDGPFPAVLMRTPYNKGVRWMTDAGWYGASRGYVMVLQDSRGRFASGGENAPYEAEGWGAHQDGYDTLEWIAAQPWCNGKIGTMGLSALGIAQLQAAATGSTRITCQHITVASPDLYRDLAYPGGIFNRATVTNWLRDSGYPNAVLKRWRAHPTDDAFWQGMDVSRRYDKIDVPAVHIGGWYDIYTRGTIDAFLGYQTKGGPHARGAQKLVMGPWVHSLLRDTAGDLRFPHGEAPPNNVHDPWRWFDYQLKAVDNGIGREPAVTYYVMGDADDPTSPGSRWRTADAWPPPAAPTPFFLHRDGTLSGDKPAGDAPLEYTHDPRHPVPTCGGNQLSLPDGPRDQRNVERRRDVLVFTTAPLAEPLEVTGTPSATLWIASDARDADFIVRLCDVYQDGRSINICEGALRARYRKSFAEETLLQPGQVTRLTIPLWPTSICFSRGHRIRIDVASSSYPAREPNPAVAVPSNPRRRTRIAHQTVYVDTIRPSNVVLPVAKP